MIQTRHPRGRRRPRVDWDELLVGALSSLWQCHVELLALVLIVAAHRLAARGGGEVVATALLLALGVVVAAVAPCRRLLRRTLRRASLRRGWERAAIDTGLSDGPLRVPRVIGVHGIPAGDILRVRVRRGQSVAALDACAGALAACLRVREVRIDRELGDAAIARVTLVRRDPFEAAAPMPWPSAAEEVASLWDPIPLGVDEYGGLVSITLAERNVLIGGEPGAGKSAALSMLVATAALDPTARVWLLDGKLVELAAWAPVAERLAGPDSEEALALLRHVRGEMEARYRELLARGRRKVQREDGLPLHLVVCDELAFYLSLPEKRQRQEFAELLRDLVARGRAAGVIVCAATQKPGSDVVPTALRDLFGFRFALRCSTPQASDTILGQGWATAGADASTIPGGQRGVGYLLAEGERPLRIKAFYLADTDVQAIAECAAARRTDAWITTAGDGVGASDGAGP